jgi:hypothetical protein
LEIQEGLDGSRFALLPGLDPLPEPLLEIDHDFQWRDRMKVLKMLSSTRANMLEPGSPKVVPVLPYSTWIPTPYLRIDPKGWSLTLH